MKQYLLNKKTGTLHKKECCCHTKNRKPYEYEEFETYEDAVKAAAMFKKDCRICFRGK